MRAVRDFWAGATLDPENLWGHDDVLEFLVPRGRMVQTPWDIVALEYIPDDNPRGAVQIR